MAHDYCHPLYDDDPASEWWRQAYYQMEATYATEAARRSAQATEAQRDCFEWLYDDDPDTAWLREAYAQMEAECAANAAPPTATQERLRIMGRF